MRLSQRVTGIVENGNDGWGLYYEAQRRLQSGQPITLLSIGDHDIGTDPRILAAMNESAAKGRTGYTSVAGSTRLRAAIAARAQRIGNAPASAENVIVTSGGQGALFAALNAVLDPGQSCVVLDPYYASFALTVRAAAARPVIVPNLPEDGFQPDPATIEAALEPDTRAILINTPNNPTGAVYSQDRLAALADLCRRYDLWLISDELYDSQVHDGEHTSPRSLPGMADRTIVIGSMSKGFAMTGSRIGWALAPTEAIARMADLAGATTYGLPGFLQDAAFQALTELPELEAEIAARYRRRRDIALAALGNARGLSVAPPQGGMYLMLDVRATGLSGIEFGQALLDRYDIGVMPGESFGKAAAGHVRVALTVADDRLEAAMNRIAECADTCI